MKDLQARNLIVPIVGDCRPEGVAMVGVPARAHGVVVRTFYTSNVEQYLFRNEAVCRFYAKRVAVADGSRERLFVRYASRRTVIDPVGDLLTAAARRSNPQYWTSRDGVRSSR